MSTPGAEDASLSPEDYSEDQDGSDMAEQKVDSQADGVSPNSEKPQKPNPKDPLRPRRKKARRACYACQRAHLTCEDNRPCGRCVKRNLQDNCVDGVRKKAKYLHDAPDAALRNPPHVVGAHYSHINNGRTPIPQPLPGQDIGSVPLHQLYTQPPTATYYAQEQSQHHVPVSAQDASPVGQFNNPPPAMSPSYNQTNQHQPPIPLVPSTVPQGGPTQMQQFGGPLFDPSDPALFNFDISSLNFGNHYGALEMSMLGHMSSGAAEVPSTDSMMNPLNQAAGMYNQQMGYGEPHHQHMSALITYEPSHMHRPEWQNSHSRQGSLQMQTPNNTPITNLEHAHHRQDGSGSHSFAIGHGSSSISSASPASTEVYDTDHTMTNQPFLHTSGQNQLHQHSPAVHRAQHHQQQLQHQHPQQENRAPGTVLQPIPSNVIRKRRRDTKWIYEGIKQPYDYVNAFHRLMQFITRTYPKPLFERIRESMSKWRSTLMLSAAELQTEDLIHQERALQLSLIQIDESYSEVGVPSVVCRRSGEIVWTNNEFTHLTNWERDVLLGNKPNLNANMSGSRSSSENAPLSKTPTIAGQDPKSGSGQPVLIMQLMDQGSAVEYFDDFADTAFVNSRGTPLRRVKFVKYQTKEQIAEIEANQACSNNVANGRHRSRAGGSDKFKMEGGPVVHRDNIEVKKLGQKDGLVDCMMQWHVKRDNFEMPMLVCMHVLPVLPTSYSDST